MKIFITFVVYNTYNTISIHLYMSSFCHQTKQSLRSNLLVSSSLERHSKDTVVAIASGLCPSFVTMESVFSLIVTITFVILSSSLDNLSSRDSGVFLLTICFKIFFRFECIFFCVLLTTV